MECSFRATSGGHALIAQTEFAQNRDRPEIPKVTKSLRVERRNFYARFGNPASFHPLFPCQHVGVPIMPYHPRNTCQSPAISHKKRGIVVMIQTNLLYELPEWLRFLLRFKTPLYTPMHHSPH